MTPVPQNPASLSAELLPMKDDGNQLQPCSSRPDSRQDPVGQGKRAGNLQKNRPYSFAEGLPALPPDWRVCTEVSDASAMQLLDVRNRCWSQYILDALEIKESVLGKVYESPDVTAP